jgi:hypothetical protein
MNPPKRPDDPIKHVILLLLENHFFDPMHGGFKRVYQDRRKQRIAANSGDRSAVSITRKRQRITCRAEE